MKMSFDHYGKDWYLLPAEMRCEFNDAQYQVTCAEDEFMEDGDETSAIAWSNARRTFNEKYGQYKIEHHVSGYAFENVQCEGVVDCSGDTPAADDEEAK